MTYGSTDLFDLFKLVHAEDTPRISSMRAGLLTETCRVAGIPVPIDKGHILTGKTYFKGRDLGSRFSPECSAEMGCSEVAIR